jgi:hypothetical protein
MAGYMLLWLEPGRLVVRIPPGNVDGPGSIEVLSLSFVWIVFFVEFTDVVTAWTSGFLTLILVL